MNLLRWIFGIPLALVISGGIIMLFENLGIVNKYVGSNGNVYLIYHLFIAILVFFTFVFLSCLFIPSSKKYAALIAVLLSLAVTGIGLYLSFTDSYTYGEITLVLLINYAARIAGLLAGIYVSYEVFKNRGWNATKKPNNNGEMY